MTTPTALPWDSPQVVTLNNLPIVLPAMIAPFTLGVVLNEYIKQSTSDEFLLIATGSRSHIFTFES